MADFKMPTPSRDDVRRGIFYILAAVCLFSAVTALAKWMVATYPVGEVVMFRQVFGAIPCLVMVARQGGFHVTRTAIPGAHVARALLQFVSMTLGMAALSLLPLADVVALQFSAPLFLTLLSVPLLGERVGPYRWGAVLVGFAGVLLMVQPGPGIVAPGAIFAIGNAFLVAVVSTGVRRMSVTESMVALATWQALLTAALSLTLLPFGWVTPGPLDLALLAALGVVSGTSQILWTQAFRYAPTAVIAPYNYLSMVWAIAIGYVVWGEVPTLALLAGAAIVVASGLFILYRETRRRAPPSLDKDQPPGQ